MALATALPEIKSRGVRVLATSSHKGTPVWECELRGPVAIVIGGEGAGIPKEVLAQADEVVAIPQSREGGIAECRDRGVGAAVRGRETKNNQPQRHRDTEE